MNYKSFQFSQKRGRMGKEPLQPFAGYFWHGIVKSFLNFPGIQQFIKQGGPNKKPSDIVGIIAQF
ncbi:MAG: hypothetical protein AB7J46_07930 [Candidatus Altimarinota bacterium]